MKLQILGCHGGELPKHRTTCFLVDDVLALDAGALCAALPLDRLCRLDHVLVSHSHFDHIKDLPLLADLLPGRREKPFTVWASTECARTLRENVFNDSLWPDFTRIPSRRNPVMQIRSFRPGARLEVGRYTVQTVAVSHPVESCGFILTDGAASVAMSGDTGPTEKLWAALNGAKNLRALFLETSFPNRLQQLADISGHLTPQTLRQELAKFHRDDVEIFLYHLKPAFVPQLKKELAGMPVEVLELGDTFEF